MTKKESNSITEREVEQYLVRRVREAGGIAIKQCNPWLVGLPDRLVLIEGRAVFVELKAPGKTPRESQLRMHERLASLGFYVWVIDSKEGVDEFMNEIQ